MAPLSHNQTVRLAVGCSIGGIFYLLGVTFTFLWLYTWPNLKPRWISSSSTPSRITKIAWVLLLIVPSLLWLPILLLTVALAVAICILLLLLAVIDAVLVGGPWWLVHSIAHSFCRARAADSWAPPSVFPVAHGLKGWFESVDDWMGHVTAADVLEARADGRPFVLKKAKRGAAEVSELEGGGHYTDVLHTDCFRSDATRLFHEDDNGC